MSRKDRFREEEKRVQEETERRSTFEPRTERLPKFDDGEERTLRILPTKEYMKWLLEANDGDEFDDDAFPYAEKWTHFQVGKTKGIFACLSKHNNEPCPVCEERNALFATKDEDDKKIADAMRISYQFAFFVAWRGKEDQPYLWELSPQWANMIISLLANPDYGDLDDPEEGHDIRVKRIGKNWKDTRYIITARPKSSYLFEDEDGELDMDKLEEWSVLIPEISDQVKPYLSYEEGKAMLGGKAIGEIMEARAKADGTDFNPKELEEEPDEKPVRRGRRRR